jgi:hypothetical protein
MKNNMVVIVFRNQNRQNEIRLQLIFRMHNSDPTPQGVENREYSSVV